MSFPTALRAPRARHERPVPADCRLSESVVRRYASVRGARDDYRVDFLAVGMRRRHQCDVPRLAPTVSGSRHHCEPCRAGCGISLAVWWTNFPEPSLAS